MCKACGNPDHAEKRISRRDALRYMGALGVAFGLEPFVTGLAAGATRLEELTKSKAVLSGKVKHYTFLQTTDIHGQVLEHPELFVENGKIVFRKTGGMSRIATLFQQIRRENPGRVFILDTGDCYQGSAIASLSRGEAMIPIMNHMGYDAAIPGNWEVIYGPQQLVRLMSEYRFPVFCANMHWGEEMDPDGPTLFPPVLIQEIDGVRFGLIGYNDPFTKVRQAPSYHKGIQFTRPLDTLPKWVRYLREKSKVDIVLLLTHLGLAQQVHLAKQPEAAGVDFLLGGDTHERTYQPIVGGHFPVVEPGSFGSFVGRLDLFIEDRKIKDYHYELIVVDAEKYEEDAKVERVVSRVRKPYESIIERPLGETETYLYRYSVLETPMDNLITDAIRKGAGVQIGISNGFRFSPPIEPGPIRVEHLYNMLPTDSQIKKGKVTGRQLWDWMENELETVFAPDPTKRVGGWVVRFSGMKVMAKINQPKGSRVQSIEVEDEPIQMDKEYTIASCDREGDPEDVICRIKKVKEAEILPLSVFAAIEYFLKEKKRISYEIEGRVVAMDAPKVIFSQLPGTDYTFH